MGTRSQRAAFWSVALAVLCVLAVLPATALGGTASVSIKRVFFAAAPGEVNNLGVSLSGTDYVLTDSGAAVAAGPGCSASGNTAVCAATAIIGLTVSGGDGADSLTNSTSTPSTLSGGDGNDALEGGSGNDTLRGNQGIDTLSAGAGDDLVDVRGDRGDIVNCGAGDDTVRGDGADVIASDCETVDRGPAPSPPPPASGPSPTSGALLGPVETGTLDHGACAMDRLGTPGDDRIDGTASGDSLFGLQGNDVLNGQANDDCLFGGVGSDRLSGAAGDDRLLGDDANDAVPGNDRLFGNAGNDLLVGGPGRDRLRGGAGRNRLRGGSGNDRLNALNGRRDRVNCGKGRDTARVDGFDRVRGCEQVRLLARN
jgi:Ca2+-binding RTX toxin-like protein